MLRPGAGRMMWVQSISSGVESFMYPEFVNSPVTLTSEKGLVGEHLAPEGLLLLHTPARGVSSEDLEPFGTVRRRVYGTNALWFLQAEAQPASDEVER